MTFDPMYAVVTRPATAEQAEESDDRVGVAVGRPGQQQGQARPQQVEGGEPQGAQEHVPLHQAELGGGSAPRSHSPTSTRSPSAQRHYQALVDNFNGPAYALDHRRDLIAWNRLAAALHVDFATVPSRDRNMIWLILTDPDMRDLYWRGSWTTSSESPDRTHAAPPRPGRAVTRRAVPPCLGRRPL